MKLFINLVAIAVVGALGYSVEPKLRYRLTGVMPTAEKARVITVMPDGAPDIDLAALPPHQLPQRVLLKGEMKVTDPASGVSLKIEAGTRVSLVRVEGGNVRVSPPGAATFEGLIPITATDLVEQVAATHAAADKPATVLLSLTEPDAPAEPLPDFDAPAAPAVVVADPEATDEFADGPATVMTPSEDPPASAGLDAVSAMKASINAAEIKEFKADQVQEWTSGPDETIDGENYQIGLASYKAETLFGVRVIQAKALIKDGKVQRWVYSKSGMDMK